MLWVFVVWPVYLTKEASTRRGGTKVLRECWTAVLSSRRTSPWRHGMAAFSWWSIWRQARTAFLGSGVPSPKEHAFSGSLRESFHAVEAETMLLNQTGRCRSSSSLTAGMGPVIIFTPPSANHSNCAPSFAALKQTTRSSSGYRRKKTKKTHTSPTNPKGFFPLGWCDHSYTCMLMESHWHRTLFLAAGLQQLHGAINKCVRNSKNTCSHKEKDKWHCMVSHSLAQRSCKLSMLEG